MKKYLMIVIAALIAACSDDTPDVVLATTTPMTVEEFTPTSVTPFRKIIVQNVRDFYEDDRKITFYFEDAKTCHAAVALLEEKGFGPVETSTMEKDGFFWVTIEKEAESTYVISSIALITS